MAGHHTMPSRCCSGAGRLVASFSTRFSFVISGDINSKAQGMAFFLAAYPSTLSSHCPDYNLALTNRQAGAVDDGTDHPSSMQRSADLIRCSTQRASKKATWWMDTSVVSDPHDTYDHIGIDISSLRSVRTLTLPSFELTDNLTGDIKYDNVSSILSVTVWLGNDNQGHLRNRSYSLSSKIDLKSALPEQVSVGISASMSNAIELHQIHSWSFSSSLEPSPPAKSSPSRPGPGVIAGEAAGATMFLVLLFAAKEALVVCRRRRQKIMEMEEYYTESEGKVDPMTEIEMGTWPRSFPYHKLVEATREELCRGAETWASLPSSMRGLIGGAAKHGYYGNCVMRQPVEVKTGTV
uniref:Legume lectin domain n=1 Tax=Hordeum vulgare TaxID=4513 RepID=A0A5J6CYK7_HORVU|nr:legume lectin domain [Hordeum vulgare]